MGGQSKESELAYDRKSMNNVDRRRVGDTAFLTELDHVS